MQLPFLYQIIIVLLLFAGSISQSLAQPRITDTPVPVQLPTNAPPPTDVLLLTPTPTTTVTEEPAIRLVAAAASADINVRDLPDVLGNRLGSLEQEREYIVTGRYFSWYQFEYGSSSSGLAWVFGDLVEIIGDNTQIPIIDPFAVPTSVPTEDAEGATATALILTPGAIETATAQTRLIDLPTQAGDAVDASNPFPPTFTPPPDVVARDQALQDGLQPTATATPNLIQQTVTVVGSGEIPPVVPIVGLFVFGLLGLIVALIRG